ncbi:hypothetical protein BDV11DRAFT_175065 [Aspergillus similis]
MAQILTINYIPNGRLSPLDTATKQPLYQVKVNRQTPPMEMIRLAATLIDDSQDMEICLRSLWACALRLPHATIGADHDFFRLAGDSMRRFYRLQLHVQLVSGQMWPTSSGILVWMRWPLQQ